MFGDTTARNRAHQEFGKTHYWWLIGIKALPWLLIVAALLYYPGAGAIAWGGGVALEWIFTDRLRAVPTLLALAVALFWLKRRWRRHDYMP